MTVFDDLMEAVKDYGQACLARGYMLADGSDRSRCVAAYDKVFGLTEKIRRTYATICPDCGNPCHWEEKVSDYQHDDPQAPDCFMIKRFQEGSTMATVNHSPMTVSALMEKLWEVEKEHGNIPVLVYDKGGVPCPSCGTVSKEVYLHSLSVHVELGDKAVVLLGV